jgi:uncharacterized membrane protein
MRPAAGERLLSLDAFRGFAIAAMLLVNNPGDWSALYAPLGHAQWHGWTFTDWIFPFFVFISGISMSFSLARRGQVDDRGALLRHAWRRGTTIVLIGLLLNLFPFFHFETVRLPGVLQRLGLITILAAPIALWCGWRAQLAVFIGLLLGYGLIQTFVAVPDAQGVWHRGSLQPGEDVGAWLDRALLGGHLWAKSKTWDPEGLLSTLPAVASQIAGLLAGRWLARRGRAGSRCLDAADQQESVDARLRFPDHRLGVPRVRRVLLAPRCRAIAPDARRDGAALAAAGGVRHERAVPVRAVRAGGPAARAGPRRRGRVAQGLALRAAARAAGGSAFRVAAVRRRLRGGVLRHRVGDVAARLDRESVSGPHGAAG